MSTTTGYASHDYTTKCPGCGSEINAGDHVTRIDLPSGRRWWHAICRAGALEELRTERETS